MDMPKPKTLAEMIAATNAAKAQKVSGKIPTSSSAKFDENQSSLPLVPKMPASSLAKAFQVAIAKPPQTTEAPLKVAGFSQKKLEKLDEQVSKRNMQTIEKKPFLTPKEALNHAPNPTGAAIELDAKIVDLGIDESALEFDQSQETALEGMVKYQYACMVGEAGTGKTTVTKRLVQKLMASIPTIDMRDAWANYKPENEEDDRPVYNVAIAFCAFMGRAVEQIKSKLPEEYWPLCNTIHATLGYRPVSEEIGYNNETGKMEKRTVFKPFFTADNKLPYKVVVVDEGGTVPIPLWNELISALPDDCRIYLIGDISQLPPVQGRSVLGFAMINWPTYALTKIHRQAADNPIIANAHRILQGLYPKADPARFVMLPVPDGSEGAFAHVIATVQKLHQGGLFDPKKDALILPTNVGPLGQTIVNEKLLMYFNPERKEKGVIINQRYLIATGLTHVGYAVGDKLMILKNDRKKGLNNGMIGWITGITVNGNFKEDKSDHHLNFEALQDLEDKFSMADALKAELFDEIDEAAEPAPGESESDEEDNNSLGQRQASHITEVTFDNGVVEYFKTAGDYGKITYAYAFTCHKTQGGEYPNVVILTHGSQSRMMCREWLYTAVTRARERVILLHNDRGLAKALKIQRIKGNSIAEKAQCFIKWQEETAKDTQTAILPKSEELKVE